MISDSLKNGASFLLSGQIIQVFVSFGSNLILVRYLFPEDFGRFAMILAVAIIVLSIFSLNIRTMIIRTSSNLYSDSLKDVYFSVILYETIFSFIVLLSWLTVFETLDGWEISLVIALSIRHWLNSNVSFFERQMPYRELALVETLSVVFGHSCALLMIFNGFGRETLFIREVTLTLLGGLGLLFVNGITLRKLVPFWKIPWVNIFSQSRGLWLDTILESSFNRIVIISIYLLGGERAAGFFFQAQRLAGVPLQIFSPIFTRIAAVWFGRAEERWERKRGRNKLLYLSAVPLIFCGIVCFLIADDVVPFLFGENWLRSGQLLSLMAGVVVFHSLFEILKAYCWQTRQMRWLLIGRVSQYIGYGLPMILVVQGILSGEVALALGQSFAFFLSFMTVLLLLENSERNW